MADQKKKNKLNRREFIFNTIRITVVLGLGGVATFLGRRSLTGETVWQLDPAKCIQCGRCATNCVKSPSAVKCVHVYDICGYCDLCGGYFKPNTKTLTTAAENQLCPTNAIKRRFV